MDDKELQPQEEAEQEAAPQDTVGETEIPEAEELGAEVEVKKTPPKPKRTFTEDEWAKREAEKDKEVAGLRQNLAQVYMQQQIAEATQREREATARDKAAVEQGLMTTEDASEREQLRREKVEIYIANQRLRAEQEDIAKSKVAQHIAKEYGVTPDELLADDIKSPVDMVKKASSLAQQRLTERLEQLEADLKKLREGEPQYDSGQKGSFVSSVGDMSPEQKIDYALKHPQKKK